MDPTALGRYLRESRETKELTLEDAVRVLKIRREYLESFEQGDFSVMDSAVRIRGMLRNYAHYLGLEEEQVLQYYEASRADNRRKPIGKRFALGRNAEPPLGDPLAPRTITDTPPALPKVRVRANDTPNRFGTILRNVAMLLVSLAALAVITFVVVDILNLNENTAAMTAITPTQLALNASVTPTHTPSFTPAPTQTMAPNVSNFEGVQVELYLLQRSWLRIVVDNVEQQVGVLEPNTQRSYQANESIIITAANAAALDIIYNGIQQETIGARGQLVELTYSRAGVEMVLGDDGVTPTSTNTAAPSTAPPSATVTAIGSLGQAEQAIASATPTRSAVQAQNLTSPTPLFAGNSDPNTPLSTSSLPTATPLPVTDALTSTAPATPTIGATPTPTSTATSAAVLPLRATSADPSPTKRG